MLNCKEATGLCSKELEEQLPLSDRLSLKLHLMMCSGCSKFQKNVRSMRVLMKTYADGGAPANDDEHQV